MQESTTLARAEPLLEDPSCPVPRRDAAASLDGTTVLMADGNTDFDESVRNCPVSEFIDTKDLYYELNNAMLVETFGGPGQSDGDA